MPRRAAGRAEEVWDGARELLDGLPGGRGLNLAWEAIGRHAASSRGESLALRWLGADGAREELSFRDLDRASNRFASLLGALGLTPGDRVATLLGRVPDLYVAALGIWKARCVFVPLFGSFGPEPTVTRLRLGGVRLLVSEARQVRRKVDPGRSDCPHLEHILVVDSAQDLDGVEELAPLLAGQPPELDLPTTDPDDPAILHFTSGTTGTPKGALHVHGAVLAHAWTGKTVLGLGPGEIYWCTADPGWVTGTSYGIIAPWVCGATQIVFEGEIDAARWARVLEEEAVTVWYTAPTAVRMLRRAGAGVFRPERFPALHLAASVGEPLHAGEVEWGREALGVPLRDTWWQTETGAIMIANSPPAEVVPGAMGRPVPGVRAAVVRADEAGVEVLGVDEVGELALRCGWPSQFRGYLGDAARTDRVFRDGWYLSGDLVRRDANGLFWFVARADDAIQTAGHLIGPREVEAVLLEDPLVAEAAVFGVPDELAGELVWAVVVPRGMIDPSGSEARTILARARRRLGPAVAPRQVELAASLPRTRSGKIQRRLLRERARRLVVEERP